MLNSTIMTKDELLKIVDKNTYCASNYFAIISAIEAYTKRKPNVMCSLPLTEGAMKTNVKKSVMGLMSEPPPPPKPSKDVSGGNDA